MKNFAHSVRMTGSGSPRRKAMKEKNLTVCKCDICERSRKYQSIVSKLKSEDDRKFMLGVLDDLCSAEEDGDWDRVALAELRANMKAQKEAVESRRKTSSRVDS